MINTEAYKSLMDADCERDDCPYCKSSLMYQRFKCMQMVQILNVTLWGKRKDRIQYRDAPLLGQCRALNCPYCTGALGIRRFKCQRRLMQLNVLIWGERKGKAMIIDPGPHVDVVWAPNDFTI